MSRKWIGTYITGFPLLQGCRDCEVCIIENNLSSYNIFTRWQ